MDLYLIFSPILHFDNYSCQAQAHINRYLQTYPCTYISFMLSSMYLSFMTKITVIYKSILQANHQKLVKLWSEKKGESTEMEFYI